MLKKTADLAVGGTPYYSDNDDHHENYSDDDSEGEKRTNLAIILASSMSCMVTATNWPSPSSSTCGQDEEGDEEGGEGVDKDDNEDLKW